MKRNKKLIALLGACALVCCLTAGCTPKEEAKGPSDTVRWFNASCAVLTEVNGSDPTLFGGMEPTEENKEAVIQLLDESWGVTDRQSAEENMDWLISEGHRASFVEFMQMLRDEGAEEFTQEELAEVLTIMMGDETEGEYLAQSFSDYITYGEHAIDGWDYSRAMSLLGWYYIAGYYTEAEALDKALEVGQAFQGEFTSWDEFMDSYFRGYEYWSYEDSSERRAIYEELKGEENSPYSVDWNTELTNTWSES